MTYLGIDIGGTRLKAGLVNENGDIIARRTTPTPTNLSDFKTAVNRLIIELLENHEPPRGAGIGCKGIVNPATSVVEICPGTFSFLEGVELSALVREHLPRNAPIFADNDARVALVGETVWGAARERQNVLLFTLGTGLGGAILAEGNIVRGASGVAGHLGHITIDANGEPCICGNRGCLETIFSARAIEAAALHAVHRGCESILTERFAGNTGALTCLEVFKAATENDLTALLIRDRAIEKLGAGIAGLLHAFDSEIVIIGGQIAEAGAALFEPLEREIGWRTKRWLRRSVPLLPPQITDAAGIVGAAALVANRK